VLAAPALLLSAPAIDAKDDVHLSPVRNGHFGDVAIAAPYSAIVFKLKHRTTPVHKTESRAQ
jgi:hypothetical protein